MYRITGQAINLRYIATEIKLDTSLSEKSTYIIKVAEFGIKHGNLLFDDLDLFQQKMKHYIHWYNMKRVHQRFNNKQTPFEKHLTLTRSDKMVA